jgi:hypothetical protein
MTSSEIIRITLALLLAAGGILLGHSYAYAYLLLLVALFLATAVGLRRLLTFRIKPYYDRHSAFKAGANIYREAAKNGGRLIATHIRPKALSPREDLALTYLKRVDKPLEYERFLLLEDKLLEDRWIKDTLTNLDKNVQPCMYFVRRCLVIPNELWFAIPRANILLYHKGNRYVCLLGLDHLQTDDERYKKTDLAVEFHSKQTFDILHRYFRSVVCRPFIADARTVEQYVPIQEKLVIRPEIQSILVDLSMLANSNDAVLHLGVFGRIGLLLNGLQNLKGTEEHDLDIDIMVIVDRHRSHRVKEKIQETFSGNEKVEIVWGDNDEYFYHFRSKGKLTIDVEIHERGTDFYKDHPLLGCSIFAYYYTLFIRDASFLHQLLHVPYGCHCMSDRIEKLLDDRKGLREFRERLSGDSLQIDPRRILSMAIRNVSWAISGARPLSTDLALEFLSPLWKEIFPSTTPKEIRDALMCNADETKASYKQYRDLCGRVIEEAVAYCERSASAALTA